ncbi:MAG: twitching motility protein PilT, partial [Frankiaceae bacterium]|nr:twitching motility protein PilT [Frankiaceae bacterium]
MDNAPPITMQPLLQALWDVKGSDLLLTPGSAPLMRLDGVVAPIADLPRLTPADTERLLYSLVASKKRDEFENQKEIDFSFSWQDQAR